MKKKVKQVNAKLKQKAKTRCNLYKKIEKNLGKVILIAIYPTVYDNIYCTSVFQLM